MTSSTPLDHLVLATPDVARTSAWIEDATGVRPSIGGPHIGRGTHNVLCSLGRSSYLEIIGPDPDQPDPDRARPFGVDHVDAAVVATWCARPVDIDAYIARAAVAGVHYSPPEAMSRRSPAGLLEWRLGIVGSDDFGGIVPFVIDWGTTAHPSRSAASGLELVSFEAGHPESDLVQSTVAELGVDLAVRYSDRPVLHVILRGPAGLVELGA